MLNLLFPFGILLLSTIDFVSADSCYYNGYVYTCSVGQTCGAYGTCHGMPTYVLVSIISSCILFLSFCIRCCIYTCANSSQRQNSQLTHVQVHPSVVNNRTRSTDITPIHNAYIVEDAPPSYAASINTSPQAPKY